MKWARWAPLDAPFAPRLPTPARPAGAPSTATVAATAEAKGATGAAPWGRLPTPLPWVRPRRTTLHTDAGAGAETWETWAWSALADAAPA